MISHGFGLDLAGYSSKRTALARIDRKDTGVAEATLFDIWILNPRANRKAQLTDITRGEVNLLRRCLMSGPLAVDIPIDLQALTCGKSPLPKPK